MRDGLVTFRRVAAPPTGHSGPRINIQIDPEAVAAAAVSSGAEAELGAASDPTSPPTDTQSAWFWAAIPDGRVAPGRFSQALAHLAVAPEAAALDIARLDQLRRLAEAHGRDILEATVGTPVSPALVLAVMAVESSGRPDAVSSAGAQGLMQLIPATAERFGVEDPFDPVQNIRGGVAYLDWLMGEFDGDPILALAGYNAGEGAVRRFGGVPDYPETRAYVPKVLAAFDIARGLCLTPPELASDGCVFISMTGG